MGQLRNSAHRWVIADQQLQNYSSLQTPTSDSQYSGLDDSAWIFSSPYSFFNKYTFYVGKPIGSTIWPLENPDWIGIKLPHSFRDFYAMSKSKLKPHGCTFDNKELRALSKTLTMSAVTSLSSFLLISINF